jgi:hypothetical protein
MCATSIYHSSASHVKPRRRANLPQPSSPTGGQPASKSSKKYFSVFRSKSSNSDLVIDKCIVFLLDVLMLFSAEFYAMFHAWTGKVMVKDQLRKRVQKTFYTIIIADKLIVKIHTSTCLSIPLYICATKHFNVKLKKEIKDLERLTFVIFPPYCSLEQEKSPVNTVFRKLVLYRF